MKRSMLVILYNVFLLNGFCQQKNDASAVNVSKNNVTIHFKLDLSGELKNVKAKSTTGVRGNTAPLSWNKTYPMTDVNNDGIYEADVTFENTMPGLRLKYKYFHDTASWEHSPDRMIVVNDNYVDLPVHKWNIVAFENTQAYHDSIELKELTNKIISLDSILFDSYNNCKMDVHAAMFSEDIEFYHDKGGLSTSKAELMESIKKNICNKVRRELLKGSIEVSPIPGYGAVELGSHRFHNLIENSTSRYSKFVIIWQYTKNEWKVRG